MRYQALILAVLAVASPLPWAQEVDPRPGAPGTAESRSAAPQASTPPAAVPRAVAQTADTRTAEPRISDLDFRIEGQQLRLSFRLVDAFDDNLKKRIDSGLYSGFTFEFELVRDRKTWFNKSLDSGSLQVVAMYNAVTREYLINLRHDGDLIDSRVVQDVAELERALTEIDDLAVFSVAGVNPRQRLRVRVRAELGTRTVFFFIPNTVHTDWEESERFWLSELE